MFSAFIPIEQLGNEAHASVVCSRDGSCCGFPTRNRTDGRRLAERSASPLLLHCQQCGKQFILRNLADESAGAHDRLDVALPENPMPRAPKAGPLNDLALSRRTLLAGMGVASLYPATEAEASRQPTASDAPPETVLPASVSHESLEVCYFDMLHLLQRVHTRLLDVVADEFLRQGRTDLSAPEAVLLFTVAERGGPSCDPGMLGGLSNPEPKRAMLNDLGRRGFLRVATRHRPVHVALTEEGRQAADLVKACFARQASSIRPLSGVNAADLTAAHATLARLDRFWTDVVLYRL